MVINALIATFLAAVLSCQSLSARADEQDGPTVSSLSLRFTFDLRNVSCGEPSFAFVRMSQSGLLLFGLYPRAVKSFIERTGDKQGFYSNLVEGGDCVIRLKVKRLMLMSSGWTLANPDPDTNFDLTPLQQEWLPKGKVKQTHLFNLFSREASICPTGTGGASQQSNFLIMTIGAGFKGQVIVNDSSFERTYVITADKCRYILSVEMFTRVDGVWSQAANLGTNDLN